MIKSIQIKNIRGFGDENNKFELNISPNKPCFLVAPNGFGKSSIAKAFNSLSNRNRIDIKIEDYYQKNEELNPEIIINLSDTILTCNKEKNEIQKNIDTIVINNLVFPKVRKRKTANGFNVQSAELKIPDITLLDKVPEKKTCDFYKVSEVRKKINNKSNTWINLNVLLSNTKFITSVYNTLVSFEKKTKNKKIFEIINSQEKIDENVYNKTKNEEIERLTSIIIKFTNNNLIESFLIAIQLIWVYIEFSEQFLAVYKYNRYLEHKQFSDSFFNVQSWFNLKPKEINVTDKKGNSFKKYGIEFPNANDISNGERDVTVFIASLLNSYFNLSVQKKDIILIIDEVFDYLDDSNLIVVQYFLNQFIKQCKALEINIYPIILTHLDTYYFSNYAFKDFNIFYLNKWKAQKDINIESFILLRNKLNRKDEAQRQLYESISKYFLHFHEDEKIITKDEFINYLKNYKCQYNNEIINLLNSSSFKKSCLDSIENYVNNKKNYEPVSVCIALRIIIEHIVYCDLLKKNSDSCGQFIEQNETIKKLKFADEFISVSADYYLLAPLYNEVLHIKNGQDNNSRLFLKLNNLFIRDLIKKVYLEYKKISK